MARITLRLSNGQKLEQVPLRRLSVLAAITDARIGGTDIRYEKIVNAEVEELDGTRHAWTPNDLCRLLQDVPDA